MGKLRTEPKVKTLDPKRYNEMAELLHEAKKASDSAHVFYDLDADENSAKVKKDLQYVAQKEGIGLKLRQPRKSRTLQLLFTEPETKQRLSAADAKTRILAVLSQAEGPMKKGEILAATGISTSSWNMRIRELTADKEVTREGNRRDTVYRLAKKKKK